jgi:hypothetical protein
MSYAQYSTTDRWKWVGGCVHEHVGTDYGFEFRYADTFLSGTKERLFRRTSAIN